MAMSKTHNIHSYMDMYVALAQNYIVKFLVWNFWLVVELLAPRRVRVGYVFIPTYIKTFCLQKKTYIQTLSEK